MNRKDQYSPPYSPMVTGTDPPAITITDPGLSGREVIVLAVAASTVITAIGIAVAVWKISEGLMWAMIILAACNGAQTILTGIGVMLRYRDAGRAQVITAQGRADAEREHAHTERLRIRHTGGTNNA